MWLQALLSFLTWSVPMGCYHCLIPRASRGLALAWKSVLDCMKMNLHGILLFTPSTLPAALSSCSLLAGLPMVLLLDTFPCQIGKKNLKCMKFTIEPLVVFRNHFIPPHICSTLCRKEREHITQRYVGSGFSKLIVIGIQHCQKQLDILFSSVALQISSWISDLGEGRTSSPLVETSSVRFYSLVSDSCQPVIRYIRSKIFGMFWVLGSMVRSICMQELLLQKVPCTGF